MSEFERGYDDGYNGYGQQSMGEDYVRGFDAGADASEYDAAYELYEYDDDTEVVDDSYNDDDGLTDAQADAMTLASAYGGDWWDM